MKEKTKILTNQEWIVMNALWDKEPMVLSEIIAEMKDKVNWSYQTFSTYLKVLSDKGFVGSNMRGRTRFYYAVVKKDDCIEAENKNIWQKLNEDGVKKLLICMLKETQISANGKKNLEELIKELENGE